MAVLSDKDLSRVIEEDEGIIITNLRKENITGAGYDLTIGFICDADSGETPEICEENGKRYTLLPGRRYLVISKEFLSFPGHYMATFHARSSYALKGIIMLSTTIDPNFEGLIYTLLINGTNQKIKIKKDNQFATIVIHKLCTPTDKDLAKNENGLPKTALETFSSRFSSFKEKVKKNVMAYESEVRKEIEPEYKKAKERVYKKAQEQRGEAEDSHTSEKNITFLIGNGFDLNIGLRTKYTDFYRYYVRKHKKDKLAKEIGKNYDNWADLESALGKYTEKVRWKDEKDFGKSEGVLEDALKYYLKCEVKRLNFNGSKKKKVGVIVKESLEGFYKDFPEVNKADIENILESISNNVEYSFITFNYTKVLEKCLKAVKSIHMFELGTHKDYKGIEYYHRIGEILHIHGTTGKEMVLGVNDESQIANAEFRNSALYKELLIKSVLNQHYGNTKDQKARDIIDKSIIICVFGMSIGETDKEWWQYIAKWLQNNQDRRLVIYARETGLKYDNFQGQNRMLERFKSNAEVSNEVWRKMKDQIYVIVNAKIFDFSQVRLVSS